MSIHVNKPYKIVQQKHKRYESHYHFPADRTLVVPMRVLGDEVSCEVRWEDDNGELKMLPNIVIVSNNLVPLDGFLDTKRLELWQHYYAIVSK